MKYENSSMVTKCCHKPGEKKKKKKKKNTEDHSDKLEQQASDIVGQ
jgi:hypothetical protein